MDRVILSTEPLCLAIPFDSVRCSNCLKCDVPLRKCSGCKQISYCGESCQRADWDGRHSFECPLVRHVRTHLVWPEFVRHVALRLAFRVMAMACRDIKHGDGHLLQVLTRPLYTDINTDYESASRIAKLTYLTQPTYVKMMEQIPLEKIYKLVCVYGCALHVDLIQPSHARPECLGFYVQMTRYAHSCNPSALTHIDAFNKLVLKRIDPSDTSPMTLPYPVLWPLAPQCMTTASRREWLKESLGCDCVCDYCRDEQQDLFKQYCVCFTCHKCKTALVVTPQSTTPSKGMCIKCNKTVPITEMHYKATLQLWASLKSATTPQPDILIKMGLVLHPFMNNIFMQVRLQSNQMEQILMALKTIECYSMNTVEYARICIQLSKLCSEHKREEESKSLIEKAKSTLTNLYGSDHQSVINLNSKYIVQKQTTA